MHFVGVDTNFQVQTQARIEAESEVAECMSLRQREATRIVDTEFADL